MAVGTEQQEAEEMIPSPTTSKTYEKKKLPDCGSGPCEMSAFMTPHFYSFCGLSVTFSCGQKYEKETK
jgi:hypothetical protein